MNGVGYYAMWVEATDDRQYRATEPDTDHDNWGRGATPAEAIAHYCELMGGGDNEPTQSDIIELTDRQRNRLNQVKSECTEGGHLPEPTDQHVISSLLDTWDAVNQGLYTDSDEYGGDTDE